MEDKKMLDNLVESKKNSAENRRLGRFLLTTFVLVFSLALSGVLWSLFAKDFGMGAEDLELTSLGAPIPVVNNEPQPELPQKPENTQQLKSANKTLRQDNILQMIESPLVPKEISVKPNTQLSRPNIPFTIQPGPETTYLPTRNTGIGPGETTSDFSKSTETSATEKPEITIPKPPPIRKTELEEKKKNITVSEGVINGKATSLPKPPYPQTAKAVGASGAVSVQVIIDEQGNVTSAKAISGHPLLKGAAETAARGAKFSPTYLSKQPVKVSGLIVYNFTKN
jgi:periplasmic protein TonB